MAQIIDGREIAAQIEAKLKLPSATPGLATLVFNDDPAGQLYSRLKGEAAARLGIKFVKSDDESLIERWNSDPTLHGVMIQRPGAAWGAKHGMSREQFETWWDQLCQLIAPQKDVDGLRQDSPFVPATIQAVEITLRSVKFPLRSGKGKIVVVGSQGLVGRKLTERLKATGVDLETVNLAEITREADVLISATGQPGLIKANMVKPGAVVIDVGWPKGDVDFGAVKNIAGAITPVPGGVGPVTVICLLENLIEAVYNQKNPKSQILNSKQSQNSKIRY